MSELRVIAVCCGWLLCGLYFGSLIGESRAREERDDPTAFYGAYELVAVVDHRASPTPTPYIYWSTTTGFGECYWSELLRMVTPVVTLPTQTDQD